MDREAIKEQLKGIISDYLKAQGLDLVELIYRYEGRSLFLRILVDRPEGGISLGECASLNNGLSSLLDEKDILQEKYILEVFSPGLDRPLKTKNDFLRCLNRQVKFFLLEELNGKIEWEGQINKVEENSVSVDTGSQLIEIPLSLIGKAKQVI